MSDFTCPNGHAVSVKERFCSICGAAIKYEDGYPRTYREHLEAERQKKAHIQKRTPEDFENIAKFWRRK